LKSTKFFKTNFNSFSTHRQVALPTQLCGVYWNPWLLNLKCFFQNKQLLDSCSVLQGVSLFWALHIAKLPDFDVLPGSKLRWRRSIEKFIPSLEYKGREIAAQFLRSLCPSC